MKQAPGLRSQFLLGLVLIIFVATITVGGITFWTTRIRVTHIRIEQGRLLGRSLSAMVAATYAGGAFEESKLQTIIRTLHESSSVEGIDVVDKQLAVAASTQSVRGRRLPEKDLVAAVRTEQQQIKILDRTFPIFVVSTPIFVQGHCVGATRLQGPVGVEAVSWPLLFWILMGIDGLVLVLFVERVVARYVIRPVQAMQQAASKVTEGDLTVRLAEDGAYELFSLAQSFNTMTASVRDQLLRLAEQQDELAASREHLIRSEKLASVGRLAAGVAHEVGNPLQAIIGFTEMMIGGSLPLAEQADFLQRTRDEAQRIHRIIRELLDYARPVEDAIEPVSVVQVVEQALQLVMPQRRCKEVEIVKQGLAELPAAAGNSQRLVQVLVNLLFNAADAMKGKGTITISGVHGAMSSEDKVELRVSNDGPLIPFEDRGRIFDPFFSTKEPGQGTGLGLSVAQSIVESYGGRLLLDQEESKTTFVIVLYVWSET
jgi:two-component system, NtrC family, sensor kinase